MTTRASARVTASKKTLIPSVLCIHLFALILTAALALGVATSGSPEVITIICFAVLCVMVAVASPKAGVIGALIVGLTAGFTRRIFDYVLPGDSQSELLVLIPGVMVLVSLLSHSSRAGSRELKGNYPRFWLIVLAALVISGLNPLGVGLTLNVATSALLALMVMSFLLTAKEVVSFSAISSAILCVGTINCLYMLAQHFLGISPWDAYWVEHKGYGALGIGAEDIRPLGLASSAAESAALAGSTAVLAFSRLQKSACLLSKRSGWMIPALAVGLGAVVFSGTRTFLILTLIAMCFVMAAGAARPKVKLLGIVIAAVPAVIWISSLFVERVSVGAARTLTTLSGKEDLGTSTIPIHAEILVGGIIRGLTSVVGTGSGQLGSLGHGQIGVLGEMVANSEVDLGNLPLMAGVIGFIAAISMYIFFFGGLQVPLRLGGASIESSIVLIAIFGQWLSAGFYGMTILAWLAFGDMVSLNRKDKTVELDGDR